MARRARGSKKKGNETLVLYAAVGLLAAVVMLTKNPVSDAVNRILKPSSSSKKKKSNVAYSYATSLAPLSDVEQSWGATPYAGADVGYYYE